MGGVVEQRVGRTYRYSAAQGGGLRRRRCRRQREVGKVRHHAIQADERPLDACEVELQRCVGEVRGRVGRDRRGDEGLQGRQREPDARRVILMGQRDVQRIGAGPAIDGVRGERRQDDVDLVVAGPCEDGVMADIAGEAVVPGATHQSIIANAAAEHDRIDLGRCVEGAAGRGGLEDSFSFQ